MQPTLRRCARAGLFATAALALAACSDSPSGPPSSGGGGGGEMTVAITAGMTANVTRAPVDPAALLDCVLTMTAKSTGPSGALAQWGKATFRFFAGADRGAPVDSLTISADEMRQAWGSPTIAAGATAQVRWRLSGGVPFSLSGDVEYALPATGVHKAPFTASCGPTPPPGAAAPVISSVTVSPASGELQPGENLSVTYTVNAPAGMWETDLFFTGGAAGEYRFRETFQATDTRTVTVPIPSGAPLGPLHVYLRVADTYLRLTQAEAAGQTLAIVDRTPPRLFSASTNAGTGSLAGQYGVGDTIPVSWSGEDENALQWVKWGIDGPAAVRDSMPATAAGANPLRIPARPEWVDASAFRLRLADRGGNQSAEIVSAAGAFRVFPVRTRPFRVAQTHGAVVDAVLDERRGMLYISMAEPRQVAVLSLASMTFGAPIPLPEEPGGLDLSLSGDSLLVALRYPTAVAVVRLDQPGTPVSVVPVAMPWEPVSLRVAADGRVLVSLMQYLGWVELSDASWHVLAADGGNTYSYNGLGRTRDRSRVVYAGACRRDYDAVAHTVSACGESYGVGPVALDDAGKVVTIGGRIYRSTGATGFPAQLGVGGFMAPTPDGSEVYAGSTRGLLRIRPDGTVLDRTTMPTPTGLLLFANGGATLLAIGHTPGAAGNPSVYAVDLR